MKQFYKVDGRFANEYDLMYCETEEDFAALPSDAHRIPRKEAIALCISEAKAQKYDPAFSGYAPTVIFPASFDGNRFSPGSYGLEITCHIAERLQKNKTRSTLALTTTSRIFRSLSRFLDLLQAEI